MTKNPFYNASAALLYIIFIVGVLRLIEFIAGNKPDNEFLAPVGAISLLVISIAVMAYLFFYHPLLLLIEGKQKVALPLFLRTIGYFSLYVIAIFLILFSLLP